MTQYRNTLFLAAWAFACAPAAALEITGAGSSAAAPLYSKWASVYRQQSGTAINYQPIGSSGGLKQIKARLTDFGGSDVALSREESQNEKLICFPSAISGVVPVVNIPGVKSGDLRLTGELLSAIFGRKILFWNDPAIAEANPDIKLPKVAIVAIVRQDGSGTTYNFTDYLSKVSPAWKQGIGRDFKVAWPAGTVQVKGSSAVSEAVAKTTGAIGYIDYSYVLQNKLIYAKMKNRAGQFVAPSALTFESALAGSSWKTKANFEEMLTDQAGRNSWPITMGTFVIVPKTTDNPDATIATLKFFTWAFMKGDQVVSGADFVRLPDRVQARIYSELTKITDRDGKPLRWNLM